MDLEKRNEAGNAATGLIIGFVLILAAWFILEAIFGYFREDRRRKDEYNRATREAKKPKVVKPVKREVHGTVMRY